MNNKEFKPLQDVYNTPNNKLDKAYREYCKVCEDFIDKCYSNNEDREALGLLNNKEFKINDGSVTIVGIDTNKGCFKIARESSDKEVLELLNNTVNDDESYEDINNNINVSVSINNSCIAAYVEGINSVLNSINKDIDYELLKDAIKDDIVKYIDIVVK